MLFCHVEVFGKMNRGQMMTSDYFSEILSLLMIFYNQDDLEDTGEDLLMTLSTLGDDLLMTLTTTGEDLLTTHDDDTDDHCANNVL
jgi:hypothetical protein